MAKEQKFPLLFSVAVFGAEPKLKAWRRLNLLQQWPVTNDKLWISSRQLLWLLHCSYAIDTGLIIFFRENQRNLSTMFLQDKTMKTKIISCSTNEVNVIRIIRVTLLFVFTTNMKYLLLWQGCTLKDGVIINSGWSWCLPGVRGWGWAAELMLSP